MRQYGAPLVTPQAEILDGPRRAIDGHPGHDLRVGEVAAPTAYLPDALILPLPGSLEKFDEAAQARPATLCRTQAHFEPRVHAGQNLAVDVELELPGRRVAH